MGRWLRLLRRLLPRLLWLLLRRNRACKSPRRQRARKCGEIRRRLASWLRLQFWLQMLKLLRLRRSLPPYLLLELGLSRLWLLLPLQRLVVRLLLLLTTELGEGLLPKRWPSLLWRWCKETMAAQLERALRLRGRLRLLHGSVAWHRRCGSREDLVLPGERVFVRKACEDFVMRKHVMVGLRCRLR